MIANTLETRIGTRALLLREPEKAAPLVRKLMGRDYAATVAGDRLRIPNAPVFRHQLAQPNHGGLTALERATLRGLLATSEEEPRT